MSFMSLVVLTEAESASSSIINAGTSNNFGVPSTTFELTSFENQSIKFSLACFSRFGTPIILKYLI